MAEHSFTARGAEMLAASELPKRTKVLEEGDVCPKCNEGTMVIPEVEDCSCHVSPPCNQCAESGLQCNVCEWNTNEG